ncbi:MAG: squalene synthase HpnC [Gammaproteobacteria bacterium]|nr:squalene synthase HpnC [Gammaproteobacteria bacterium]
MPTLEQKTAHAYKYCMAIAKNHYENFPVASHLLTRKLRYPVSAVYAFARTADDFADEGNYNDHERLKLLNQYIDELDQISGSLDKYSGNNKAEFLHQSESSIFIALADTIYRFQIPLQLFYDLINAFKQDVTKQRYQTFDELLDYCRLSANPVGQILLYLNKSASKENLEHSDAICTGLQLINFYQDIGQDIDENDRLYLPLEELSKYQISIDDIKNHLNNDKTQAFFKHQLNRTNKLYDYGKPLCSNLSGRFAIEIRMIFSGGKIILNKLEKNTHSIYQRPRLSHFDKFRIILHGLFSYT